MSFELTKVNLRDSYVLTGQLKNPPGYRAIDTITAWRNPYGFTKRAIAWYGDVDYNYSGISLKAALMPDLINKLMRSIFDIDPLYFNSCLLNKYPNGAYGIGYHSDNEEVLEPGSSVAIVSLGENRTFKIKNKETREVIEFDLEHGSVLVMGFNFQTYWSHCIPQDHSITKPRISLTFRRTIDG